MRKRYSRGRTLSSLRWFDEAQLTHMMLAAARSLPQLKPGVYSFLDLRLSSLWREQHKKAEIEWL